MDQHSILTKTAKGLAEATGRTSQLSRALRKLLKGIDGRTPLADLAETFTKIPEAELLDTLQALKQQGFVRELPRAGAAAPAGAAKGEAAQERVSDEDENLDFTTIAGPAVAQPPDDFAARAAAAARAEAAATAIARAEGEAAARAQAEAEAAQESVSDEDEAAAKAEVRRAEAAALVRAHHETKAKQAAEATAKAEAEAAELRGRLEEEHKAREELERKAKEDAERAVREAQEWARREAEERAQREAEERAGREAELREAKQRLEAEESARRQAVEQARREAEELRAKLDTERKAREDAERRAREKTQHRPPATTDFPKVTIPEPAVDEAQLDRAAEERAQEVARRFQEEQAKRAAERQAQREETERKRAVEEAALREQARAAEETKQKRLREEEERRRAAEEAERDREAEKALAHQKALEKALAAGDAAMRARKQAREEELATERRRGEIPAGGREITREPQRARRRGRIAAVLFLLVVGVFAAPYFVPIDVGPFEREATARFGTPVKIGSAHLSLLPMPALRFERVSIGPAGDLKIAAVSSQVGIGAIFHKQTAFKTLELDDVRIPASWLSAAIWGKGGSGAFRMERLIARGVRVEAPELELPVLNVDAKLDSGGALQSLSAQTTDRKQTFNLTMTDGNAAVEISARPFRLPFPDAVQFGDLVGSGTLTRSELTLSKFEMSAFGGLAKGNARVRWGATWSVEGEFIAASMNPRLATASLVPTGRLEGKGTFSMRAPNPSNLHQATRMDATFTVKNGSLGFVDLTRALQGGNTRGGTTSFASLDGNASFGGGSVRLTQLRLAAGLLNATGEATVDPRKKLNGRLQVDLTSQARGMLTLGGAVAAPQVKR